MSDFILPVWHFFNEILIYVCHPNLFKRCLRKTKFMGGGGRDSGLWVGKRMSLASLVHPKIQRPSHAHLDPIRKRTLFVDILIKDANKGQLTSSTPWVNSLICYYGGVVIPATLWKAVRTVQYASEEAVNETVSVIAVSQWLVSHSLTGEACVW